MRRRQYSRNDAPGTTGAGGAGGASVSVVSMVIELMPSDSVVMDLSPRQLEIISAMTRGLSNAEIAEMLGIDATTVRNHIVVLFQKLGAANRAEAITIALRKQLIKA